MPINDMLDGLKKKAADSFENVSKRIRGANVTPQASTGTAVVPFDPVRGNPAAPPKAPAPTLLQRGARGLANVARSPVTRAAGGLGAAALAGASVKTAFDAAREGNTDEDYATAERLVPKFFPEGLRHNAMPISAAVVGAGRRFVNNLNPFSTAGASTQTPVVEGKIAPASIGASVPAATTKPAAPVDDGLVPTLRGNRVTPASLVQTRTPDGRVVGSTEAPAAGFGVIQRTTPGNRGEAIRIRTDQVNPGTEEGNGLRLPRANSLAGHMTNLAALGAQAKASEIRESGALAQANLGIKRATANAALATARNKITNDRNQDVQREIKLDVERRLPEGLDDDERKEFVQKGIGEVESRFRHSLATQGKDLGSTSPEEVRELVLLNKMRDRVQEDRSSIGAFFRDLIGDKRFDSDNLYSYRPKVVKAGAFKYNVELPNGNVIPVSKAAGKESNWLSPNGPVDKDIMDVIIELERRQKGK